MSEELKARAVCHACASQPRAWLCPVCDNELAALKAGQREAMATICMGCVDLSSHVRELEHKMDYYKTQAAPPASADAVSVPRELLERLSAPSAWLHDLRKHQAELRALLARQE